MIKKFGLVTALTMALLFGGVFTNSAHAAANIDQPQSNNKIYYSMNDGWKTIHWDQFGNYLNHYFKNWHKVYWNSHKEEQGKGNIKVEQPNQDTSQVEQPKPEKPQIEQSKPEAPEVQQPKPETPTIDEKEKEQSESNQEYQLNQFEQQVVDLTNDERAKNGLAPLKADWELSRVAREKSRDLAINHYFAHNSPTYGSPFDMMKAYGISYRTAGENIAKGQRTPQEVVTAWMNSPGHRANILNGNFTHIGVGYVEQGNHWTQMFIGK